MSKCSTTTEKPRPIRLGVLTPSSNTALEPLTSSIVATLPGVSVHYSRFKVTEIALDARALGQFNDEHILAAAELLADANVDVIGWSGTAAGWMGFEKDRLLVQRIQERTGIPATTAILALNELLALKDIRRLALLSPYTEDVQQRIIENYQRVGIDVVASSHESIRVNFDFSGVEPDTLLDRMSSMVPARPEAFVTYCTNLRAAQLAQYVEEHWGIPLLDTVSTTIWGMLRMAGADSGGIKGWGVLYEWR